MGFVCKNQDQPTKKCNDYRVRFSCHPPFCGGGGTVWTHCTCAVLSCSCKVDFPLVFIVRVHKHSFRMVLWLCTFPTVTLSLFYCSLQCAGPNGMTGTTPVEQGTGSFWATWRQRTQERFVTTPCTLRLLPLTLWPQPSTRGRPSSRKLPYRGSI